MKDQFSSQKRFSEILDHSFQLIKSNFSTFFLVFLILLGPLYLIEALLLLSSGVSFFREVGTGGNWFEDAMSGFDEGVGVSVGMNSAISFLLAILGPVAVGSILFGINRIRNQETFTAGSLIKQAFTRFGPLVGSTLIVGIIFIAMIIPVFIIFFVMAGLLFTEPVAALIGVFVMLFIIFIGFVLLFTRWGFFLAVVTFNEGFPGIPESWRLTKKHTWRVFGLFLVIFLITVIIAFAIDAIAALVLGNSVLYMIIINLTTILVSMINAVVYAVIYFDLKLRQDGDDLREMIDEYQND
ncbi:hypothetical protein [Virgibacillus kimchii]